MSERTNQRIAYFNGRYVPESEVRVPFRDRSFQYGDGCFDMTRTFAGKPFRVKSTSTASTGRWLIFRSTLA